MLFDSIFHSHRKSYQPKCPKVLMDLAASAFREDEIDPKTSQVPEDHVKALAKSFKKTMGQKPLALLKSEKPANQKPLTIACVLSGGQAPGGHNVILGLYEGLQSSAPGSKLLGFLGGPSGILENRKVVVDEELVGAYRNTGGFDMLGSGRTKIASDEQFATCLKVLTDSKVDSLVIIGGDDSNTNAALLAEYFKSQGSAATVIGIPKTIDGDLKNAFVETSFGFDTAVRLYSELISNVCRDAASAKKYYHFIRLMGRSASHITLEAMLQSRANWAIISEEVAAKNQSLTDVVRDIAEMVIKRAAQGQHYGVVLVPEGLVEFVPQFRNLIKDLNQLLADHRSFIESLDGFSRQKEYLLGKMSNQSHETFSALPDALQKQMLHERDPHGNVQVSAIETEKLIAEMVASHLKEAEKGKKFSGKFSHQSHFFGYEGRCAAPTNFDANYTYCLGKTAVALARSGRTGYMAVIRGLTKDIEEWQPYGAPLTAMMNLETRHGEETPVIKKALVDPQRRAFKYYSDHREKWATTDSYRFVGPIQYYGPKDLTDQVPMIVMAEYSDNTFEV
jgi:diphosphate-dependent phosphofructokinase